MGTFTVRFCLSDSEYLTALRLVAGAVCSVAGKDVDAIEDFKVCVTESALIFRNCGSEQVEAVFSCGDGVRADIRGIGGEPHGGDNELSMALISALVSDFSTETDGDVITGISLVLS